MGECWSACLPHGATLVPAALGGFEARSVRRALHIQGAARARLPFALASALVMARNSVRRRSSLSGRTAEMNSTPCAPGVAGAATSPRGAAGSGAARGGGDAAGDAFNAPPAD